MAKMIEPQKNTFFHQASVASLSSVGCALSPPLGAEATARRLVPLPIPVAPGVRPTIASKRVFDGSPKRPRDSAGGCASLSLVPPLRLVAGRRSPLPPPSCTVLSLTLPSVADGAQAVPPAKPCSCWRSDAPPTPEMAYSSSKTPPAPGRPRVVIAWDPPELRSP